MVAGVVSFNDPGVEISPGYDQLHVVRFPVNKVRSAPLRERDCRNWLNLLRLGRFVSESRILFDNTVSVIRMSTVLHVILPYWIDISIENILLVLHAVSLDIDTWLLAYWCL
jgi:hypothetical protein